MFSMKNIDGKESITANRVNIATEFNEIKDTLSNKKVLKHKIRRIQDKKKKHEIKRTKSTKYRYHVSMINDSF